MYQEKITELKKQITEFAGFVEEMIEKSINGLLTRNESLLKEVIDVLEPKANFFELAIDEACTTVIAQYEPKAIDLRIVLMVMKMNTDLERMGDHAVNISESAQFLVGRPSVKPLIDTPRMAKIVTGMVHDSIKAFVNNDVSLARSVCLSDTEVDELKDQSTRELITIMVSDASTIERALHIMRIFANLERIADLSTNICEEVLFIVSGTVIKHHTNEKK
ncbi:MAG: phosphate signaling complex protein PhoU [Endomicrobiales bacterium]|nr:phosphate signaling complex protein PhoU [Endomicrobiales bacterium]